MKKPVLVAIRLILSGVFLYAGITKMISPLPFADSIATFEALPNGLINIVALGLPVLEVALGGMLLIGFKLRAASFGVLILSIIFFLALAQGVARGLEIDCGCFGSGEPSVAKTWLSIGRATLLIGTSLFLYLSRLSLCTLRTECPSENRSR